MAAIKDAKKGNFELKKLKIKSGKVITDYVYLHDENPDSEKREYKGVVVPLIPHPDLNSLFSQLREYLLKDFYIDATPENIMYLEITSINLSGEEEKRGLIINGVFETLHGGKVALNSSRILLEDNATGLEEEIDVIVDAIIDESFKYLFKGKRADPTLFEPLEEITDVKVKKELPDEENKSGLNVSKDVKLSKVG